MKLTELTEGLLKLPVNTAQEILNGVMHTALTMFYYDVSSSLKPLIAGLLKSYSAPKQPDRGSFIVNLPPDPLPSKLQALMKKSIPIKIGVSLFRGSEWNPYTKTMTVNVSNMSQIWTQPNPEKVILGVIEDIKGTISHELTHAYQIIIKKLDPRYDIEKSNYTSVGDQYYTSDIEFDPQIKSTIGFYHRLRALTVDAEIIKRVTNSIISGRYTGTTLELSINQALEKTQDPDEKITLQLVQRYARSALYLADFYYHIKKDNPQKWKKAVKYLIGQL